MKITITTDNKDELKEFAGVILDLLEDNFKIYPDMSLVQERCAGKNTFSNVFYFDPDPLKTPFPDLYT